MAWNGQKWCICSIEQMKFYYKNDSQAFSGLEQSLTYNIDFNTPDRTTWDKYFIGPAEVKKKDIYNWLSIPSRFKLLQRMVRRKLMEMIGDRNNILKIEAALKKYEEAIKEKGADNVKIHNFRVSLENDELLQRHMMNEINELKQYCGKMKTSKRNNFEINEGFESTETSLNIDNEHNKMMKNSFNMTQPTKKKNKGIFTRNYEIPQNYIWNSEKEQDYSNLKQKSISLLTNIANSAHYIDCGLSKFVQEIINNDQVKN